MLIPKKRKKKTVRLSIEPVYKKLGDAIRTRRVHLGMTQETVAKKMKMSRPALANIESGRQRILIHHLMLLSPILMIPAYEFVKMLSSHSKTRKCR